MSAQLRKGSPATNYYIGLTTQFGTPASFLKTVLQGIPGGSVVRVPLSLLKGPDSIHGLGNKIQQAAQWEGKKKKASSMCKKLFSAYIVFSYSFIFSDKATERQAECYHCPTCS